MHRVGGVMNNNNTMKKHYEIFWHRGRGTTYQSELVETFSSREQPITFVAKAFDDWGTAGHPDYVGGWWSVEEITTSPDESGEFGEIDCQTILQTEVCR